MLWAGRPDLLGSVLAWREQWAGIGCATAFLLVWLVGFTHWTWSAAVVPLGLAVVAALKAFEIARTRYVLTNGRVLVFDGWRARSYEPGELTEIEVRGRSGSRGDVWFRTETVDDGYGGHVRRVGFRQIEQPWRVAELMRIHLRPDF